MKLRPRARALLALSRSSFSPNIGAFLGALMQQAARARAADAEAKDEGGDAKMDDGPPGDA